MADRTLALLVRTFPKLSESFILSEVLALQDAGVPLIVYALQRPPDALAQPAAARLRCPVVYLPALPEPELVAALADHWKKAGIAHVHAHFIDGPARLAELATAQLGIRFSISAHAKDIYLSDAETLAARMRAAVFTVTCTGYNLEQLRQRAGSAAVHCNHHGVDSQFFSPPASRAADGPLKLLTVGRLRPKKGFGTALRALALLHKDGVDARLTIVGYGPEADNLQALAQSLGVSAHVDFRGKQSHRELQQHYREHHVFLAPSEITADGDRDGIPNVLLEAMASELAVVASDVSGIPEAIDPGVSGLLCPPGNARALASAIGALARDPDLRHRLGSAARRKVAMQFSEQASRDRLRSLLAPCLAAAVDPTVGYVVMGFPRRSEAFISNELLQLERLGMRLQVFAIKAGDDEEPHQSVRQLRSVVRYLPRLGSLSGTPFLKWLKTSWSLYGAAHKRLLRQHPLRYLRVALRALAMCVRYPRRHWLPRKVFIKEFLQAGAIAEQVLALPTIRHLHGHFCHGATTVTWMAADLAGLRFSFTAHAKDIWQQEQNPGDLLDRKIAAADFVVTCTENNRRHLHGHCHHPKPVATVYHGLDTQFFQPAPGERVRRDRPLILAVGRLVEKKGFRHLIDACAVLHREGLEFECAIVGEEGPERPTLAAQITANGLENLIRFHAPMTHEALRDVYRQASIFVLPCLVAEDGDRDGIPNVLAEAMAMELPVVSTAVSGIPEIVVDGQNGRLVEECHGNSLANAMRALLADSDTAARLGRNARQTILSKFDAARTHVALKLLFDQSLAKSLPLEHHSLATKEAAA